MFFFHQQEMKENMMVTIFDLDKDPAEWSEVEEKEYETAEEKITASCEVQREVPKGSPLETYLRRQIDNQVKRDEEHYS